MYLDSKLERFAKNLQDRAAIRFGVIGAGQCGGKITELFASLRNISGRQFYDCIAINSWGPDLDPLKYISNERKLLLEGGHGCGHKPKLCYKLMENPENQRRVKEHVTKYLSDSDAYIVCAGLAGGTGTGLISTLIKVIQYLINKPLAKAGKSVRPVNAIVTIPKNIDTLLDKANCMDEIDNLFDMLNKGMLQSLIIIDNEKAYKEFHEYKSLYPDDDFYTDWMDYSNKTVVQAIHEFNIGICYPTERNFDTQDMKNIFEDYPGVITISKHTIPLVDLKSSTVVEDIISSYTNAKVLADGLELKKSSHAGYLIVKPRFDEDNITDRIINELDMRLATETPIAYTRPGTCILNPNREDKRILVYTISKVTQKPKRIREDLPNEIREASVNVNKVYKETYNEVAATGTNFTNELSIKSTNIFDDTEIDDVDLEIFSFNKPKPIRVDLSDEDMDNLIFNGEKN